MNKLVYIIQQFLHNHKEFNRLNLYIQLLFERIRDQKERIEYMNDFKIISDNIKKK